MANFRKLLEEALTTAEHSLDRVKNNKDKEFRNEFFKEKWMNVLLNRQEQIKIEIENLREEWNKIDWRLKDLNPRISSSTYNEMNEQWYTWQDRNTNESDYYVFNKLKDSLEYSNYKNFDSIRKRFTQNMNFAISSKEQRAVVAEFYWLDWTSLWIEIPMDIKFDSISIVDWEIKVKPKALSSWV